MPQSAVAFLAAPFIGLLVAVPVVTAVLGDFGAWGLYFGFGLFLAYPAALIVGVPLYLIIKRCVPVIRLWHAIAAGAVSAMPLVLAWLYPFTGPYFENAWAINVALAISVGMASGAAFWLLMWRPRSNHPLQRTASPPAEL